MQDLIEREQREMRKNWRERSKNYIEEKKYQITTLFVQITFWTRQLHQIVHKQSSDLWKSHLLLDKVPLKNVEKNLQEKSR